MTHNEDVLEHEIMTDRGVHVLRMRSSHLEDRMPLVVLDDEVNGILEDEDAPHVVINFECVEFLATTALAKLINCHEKVISKGGDISLCCIQEPVAEILEVTRFEEIFNIYETEADAVENT